MNKWEVAIRKLQNLNWCDSMYVLTRAIDFAQNSLENEENPPDNMVVADGKIAFEFDVIGETLVVEFSST